MEQKYLAASGISGKQDSRPGRKVWYYEILLAVVIIVRSSGGIFTKITLESMGPYTLLAFRFLLAFVLLTLVFWPRLRRISLATLKRGIALGVALFCMMAAETVALQYTTVSVGAFLENTAIVLVPLLDALLLRRAPRPLAVMCCCITLLGIGLVVLQGGGIHLGRGEWLSLLAAVLYAAFIIMTDRFAHREDPLLLGVVQMGVIGVLSLFAACLLETPNLPGSAGVWGSILYLAVVCSGIGFALQPLAQSRTSAEKAGLFCALNPLGSSVLGILFLHDSFSLLNVVGGVLILVSILLHSCKGAQRASS